MNTVDVRLIVEEHAKKISDHDAKIEAIHETMKDVRSALDNVASASLIRAHSEERQTDLLSAIKTAVEGNTKSTQYFSALTKYMMTVLVVILVVSFVFITTMFGRIDGNLLINKMPEFLKEAK